jgi:hypothetical protein
MRILGKRAGSAQFSTTAANKRLIVLLSIFATALLIPLGFLANHVYKQFSEEMYYEYRWNAEKVVKYTDKHVLVNSENLNTNKDKSIAYATLRPPLENVTSNFTTKYLPSGPGLALVDTLLMVFSLVIGVGIFVLYRAGTKQILLAEERLNKSA